MYVGAKIDGRAKIQYLKYFENVLYRSSVSWLYPRFRVRYSPRDARPNRSTSDLSRPCQLGAAIQGFRPRQCLLRAHGFSADCVKVGGGRLALPSPSIPICARAFVCLRKMKLDIKLVEFLLIHNFIAFHR